MSQLWASYNPGQMKWLDESQWRNDLQTKVTAVVLFP